MSSLRIRTEGLRTEFLPNPASVENFKAVFSPVINFGRSLINSVIVAGSATIFDLDFRIHCRLRVGEVALPGSDGGVLADHGLFDVPDHHLGPATADDVSSTEPFTWFTYWVYTYQAVILPSLSFALPLAVWNLTGYFKQLRVELEQAATVDGCTPGVAFQKVILPLAAPGVFQDGDHRVHRRME